MSSMCTPMSTKGPPPAVARRVNQLPTPGMPWRRSHPVLAKQMGIDDLLQCLDIATPAVIEHHVEYSIIALGRVHHLTGSRCVFSDRFLAKDVDTAVEGGHGDRPMQCGRRGDADDIEFSMIK